MKRNANDFASNAELPLANLSLPSWFGRNKFNALESALLAKVQESLPTQSREILQKQLSSIVKIRRVAGQREVLCYRKKRATAKSLPAPAFPSNRAELKFCT